MLAANEEYCSLLSSDFEEKALFIAPSSLIDSVDGRALGHLLGYPIPKSDLPGPTHAGQLVL